MEIVNIIDTIKRGIIKVFTLIWNSQIFKIILICLVIFLTLANYWCVSLFSGNIDYNKFGTIGEWFSNFATIITIAVAAATIRNDRLNAEKDRNLTLQLKDEESRENLHKAEELQRIREKSVYVWIGGEQDSVTYAMSQCWLCTSNKTGEPVFEWQIINEDGKILASSKAYGPIYDDVQKEIQVDGLLPDTQISIQYQSFSGKWYKRKGANAEEIAYD